MFGRPNTKDIKDLHLTEWGDKDSRHLEMEQIVAVSLFTGLIIIVLAIGALI